MPLQTITVWDRFWVVPAGKPTELYGISPSLMGNSTVSMAIFNGKLLVHQMVNSAKSPAGRSGLQGRGRSRRRRDRESNVPHPLAAPLAMPATIDNWARHINQA